MLDASASWRAIARRHAPADVADRLVDNPFFEAATQHFPASQSYASAEEMANYLETRAWDLVVVDTPPSAGGIEFFSAPAEMRDLIGGRLLRWLTGGALPGRRTFFSLTARPALRIAGAALGSDLLERVAEFLMDLRTMYDGLARRAAQIEDHFRTPSTVVVTTADPAPLRKPPVSTGTSRQGSRPGFRGVQPGPAGELAPGRCRRPTARWWRTSSVGEPKPTVRPTCGRSSRRTGRRRSPPWPWRPQTPTRLDDLAAMVDRRRRAASGRVGGSSAQ